MSQLKFISQFILKVFLFETGIAQLIYYKIINLIDYKFKRVINNIPDLLIVFDLFVDLIFSKMNPRHNLVDEEMADSEI